MFKMFMNQTILKSLGINYFYYQNIPFITYFRTMDYFENLLELNCDLDIDFKFFCQLS